MPIDMDMYDSAYEDGCNDCGDIGMPPPRLRPIYEKIGRSLESNREKDRGSNCAI